MIVSSYSCLVVLSLVRICEVGRVLGDDDIVDEGRTVRRSERHIGNKLEVVVINSNSTCGGTEVRRAREIRRRGGSGGAHNNVTVSTSYAEQTCICYFNRLVCVFLRTNARVGYLPP